jgi:hypothetical protein
MSKKQHQSCFPEGVKQDIYDALFFAECADLPAVINPPESKNEDSDEEKEGRSEEESNGDGEEGAGDNAEGGNDSGEAPAAKNTGEANDELMLDEEESVDTANLVANTPSAKKSSAKKPKATGSVKKSREESAPKFANRVAEQFVARMKDSKGSMICQLLHAIPEEYRDILDGATFKKGNVASLCRKLHDSRLLGDLNNVLESPLTDLLSGNDLIMYNWMFEMSVGDNAPFSNLLVSNVVGGTDSSLHVNISSGFYMLRCFHRALQVCVWRAACKDDNPYAFHPTKYVQSDHWQTVAKPKIASAQRFMDVLDKAFHKWNRACVFMNVGGVDSVHQRVKTAASWKTRFEDKRSSVCPCIPADDWFESAEEKEAIVTIGSDQALADWKESDLFIFDSFPELVRYSGESEEEFVDAHDDDDKNKENNLESEDIPVVEPPIHTPEEESVWLQSRLHENRPVEKPRISVR